MYLAITTGKNHAAVRPDVAVRVGKSLPCAGPGRTAEPSLPCEDDKVHGNGQPHGKEQDKAHGKGQVHGKQGRRRSAKAQCTATNPLPCAAHGKDFFFHLYYVYTYIRFKISFTFLGLFVNVT